MIKFLIKTLFDKNYSRLTNYFLLVCLSLTATQMSFPLKSFANEIGQSETSDSGSTTSAPVTNTNSTRLGSPAGENISAPECILESSLASGTNQVQAIRSAVNNLSDQEIQARLVLAETITAGRSCLVGKQREGISQSIAWVVSNRMNHPEGIYGQGREAIFRRLQFSSFQHPESRRAFLCPSSLNSNWQNSWEIATRSVSNTQRRENNPLENINHYVFARRHFPNTTRRPNWARRQDLRRPDVAQLKHTNCIEFYEVR